MGTLVVSTQYGVIIALYQSCISDTNGQSVEFFYDFWCNWHSLKPFLPRVILTQEKRSGDLNKTLSFHCGSIAIKSYTIRFSVRELYADRVFLMIS